MVEISLANPSAAYTVAEGEEVIVRLPENPTTGYRWQLSQSGDGALNAADDLYSAGAAPGAAGERVFRLVATKRGKVRLELAERREWETSGASLRQQAYDIVVR